jgi:hypothetical protein
MKTIVLGLIAGFSLLLLSQAYLELFVMREGLEDGCSAELLKDYRARLDELEKKQSKTDSEVEEILAKQKEGEEQMNIAIEGDPTEINNLE